VEYEFENDEEFEMLVDPDEPAPFPDISAEVTVCVKLSLKRNMESRISCRMNPR
jgi:hypothetical protein